MSKSVKYILVAVAVLLILVLIPALVPLEKYKSVIETKVQDAIGRELTIDGNISLSILPRPKVKIDGIKLASLPNAAEPYLLEVKSAEAAIAISPLFLGKIVVSYVELKNPKVVLEKLKNGKANWEFASKATDDAAVNLDKNEKQANSNELPLNIQRVIVSNGELTYIEGSDRKGVQDLNLDVNLASIKGPVDFNLAFKVLDRDISLNGSVKEISNIIPLVAELRAQGATIKLTGDINVDSSSFKGNLSTEGNLKNLKSTASSELPAGLKEDYKFSSTIIADKTGLTCDDIAFKIGAASASGQAKYDVENAKGVLNLNLMPGNIALNLTPKGNDNGYVVSKIQLQANSIKPFLEVLKIDLSTLPEFLTQALSVVADLKYKDQELLVDNIDFSLGKASLQGATGIKNWSSSMIANYDLKTKNGDALVSLLGAVPGVKLGELQIRGESSKNDKIIETNTTISIAKLEANIKGTIDTDKDIKPNLSINAKGNSLNETITNLTQKPSIKKLGGFNISGSITGNANKELKLTIEKSSITLGNDVVSLSGAGDVKLDSIKPKASLNFQISNLNLDSLAESSGSPSSRNSNASAVNSSPASHWSREKIDLAFLHNFDGDLNLTIQKITSGALIFDNFKTKLILNDGVFNISSLTGNLYGGKLEGSGRVTAKKDGSGDINFKASLNNAQLKNIVPTQGKIKVTQGMIDFNADIKTKGSSEYSYVDNLSGTVSLNGRDGRLSGLDLQKIVRTLNDAKNLQNILKSLDNSFLQGETAFKTIENKINIDRGIANLAVSKVVADGGEANATGNINLPRYQLDINADIKVDIKNMPPFKAHLYGMLDNPQYKLDLKALQQYLVNNVLTNVIDSIKSGKTRPEDILKGILGGGKNKQAPADNEPQQSNDQNDDSASSPKNEVNNLINKGLKGLFK